jgi:tRNA-splicing ligase RtcB
LKSQTDPLGERPTYAKTPAFNPTTMGKNKLKGKDLKKIDFILPNTQSMAINVMAQHFKHHSKEEKLAVLVQLKADPSAYLDHPHLGTLAERMMPYEELAPQDEIALKQESGNYNIFGGHNINENAVKQMDVAMKLPVAAKGALMPDAHMGYGLPIGGVLATDNAVIPYAVGMDIGCRMCLTVYDLRAEHLQRYAHKLKTGLYDNTAFGQGKALADPFDDEILDRAAFSEIGFLRVLHKKARRQVGSSGSGNHFVEFGVVEVPEFDPVLGIPAGEYVGVLSHSGSRGLGANIAKRYTELAMDKCYLPRQAKNLAWLDLDTEAGMEYWIMMQLAGDYATACHDHIHRRMAKVLGEKPIAKVENHHNFAWKEMQPDGREMVVHRKGATPAGKDVLGIIPGSMTAPGYIVKGAGNPASINSAAHGAGRALSRSKAKQQVTRSAMNKLLRNNGITLIGGSPDEAPVAYKDIDEVMKAQRHLVDAVGKFYPRIVRMDRE